MKCCQWLPADLYVSQHYSLWNVVSDFQQIVMFHSVTLYKMLSVTSSRLLCFTALLCMKCCQWLPADLYVSQRYSVWNVVSDFQQIIMFPADHVSQCYSVCNVVSDIQQIFMFHSVTLYAMWSVTSSRSLCFTVLLCMKCCQWLSADRHVSQRYSVWNVVSNFQQIFMFHSITLYNMLSVTSSRSLCFTALLCMKCCQWLPADRYVPQRYSVWNIVGDFQQIFMFHSVTLWNVVPADHYVSQRYSVWNVVSDFQQIVMFHSVTLYEMLSVTSSRSLCSTALLCMKYCRWLPADLYVSQRYSMKCCQWPPADLYVSQHYSVWNVVSDFQQIVMFHSVTLYEILSVTSSRSLCFTALLCMKCCQWLPADHYVSQRYSVWNVVSDFQQIAMFHNVTLYEMLSVTSSRSLCFTALLCMKCCQWLPADHYVSQRYSVWNVVSDFQQIAMFHSVTLYEML